MASEKKKRRKGLLDQIYKLVALGVTVMTVITIISQSLISRTQVLQRTKALAVEAIGEAISCVEEYPAYRWLLTYWYEHAGELDIEYDVGFGGGTVTEEKCRELNTRYPDLQLHYALQEEIEALPEEDQKKYAEVIYTWMLARFNEIKQNLQCDFLCLLVAERQTMDSPFASSVYIFSGADQGTVRGENYGEAYPLGVTVEMTPETNLLTVLQDAAAFEEEHPGADLDSSVFSEVLEEAGNYVDYYTCLMRQGLNAFMIGTTYNRRTMENGIRLQTVQGTLHMVFFLLALVYLIINRLLKYGVKPLRRITRHIRTYTETKDSQAVCRSLKAELSGKHAVAVRQNEIGQLAEDFMSMTAEIDEYVDEIERVTADKQRIEVELNVAADIQKSMLPAGFPEREDCTLFASMNPAREVGGDFYDYFFIDEKHLALVIADVSDKGVPAALFMVIAKTLIKNRAMMGEEPGVILANVNNQLCENNEAGYFVTVWLAIIDLTTGKGLAANAGHEHPALARKGEDYGLIVYRHSPVIGMLKGIPFMQHSFTLNPGDSLFVYTDGVPEADNVKEKQFGTDRMLKALNEGAEKPPEEVIALVKKAVESFAGAAPQFDDMTMMCFQYHGPKDIQA